MADFDRALDARLRAAAFEWLASQSSIHGDVLPRQILTDGFDSLGHRIRLLGPQGIFKPKAMALPLSIATVPSGPYGDAFGSDNLLQYQYRGTDPGHRDNVGLRFAMQHRLPLAYFHRILPGKYLAVWPVYVVGDAPERLTFSVELAAGGSNLLGPTDWGNVEAGIRRRYATVEVQRRLHQGEFRERVLRAYRHQCALCRLRHDELLDAAHIIPDSDPGGTPTVSNGLALCRLHHAAFDRFFVGIRKDYIIQVRPDVLREHDGPTLRHSIQGLHNRQIILPRRPVDRPAINLLAVRYEQFREAAITL
ncbi:MAG: HNH endonuclease [Gemmatimonadota bacterium]|nr:HNH endonuclease [Gemmatimonadota bacterium]MDE2872539.1 HNH endonuclease [Gemmatimonadota bacterium]